MNKRFSKNSLRFLCLFVAVSFLSVLVPIASASLDKSNTMPCCAGKAGHCDSGLAAKPAPRISEPMCGRDHPKSADDANTIVAEPPKQESQHSHSHAAETTSHAAESISLHKPCPMDCGACMASSQRQQRRERGILQPFTYLNPTLVIYSKDENQPFSFCSNEDWDQISPRGPPAV
ncbi:MAG TPA: hypothetical protein VN644_07405 [Pyrinomonadaceae bacterium]|nr:hypothetical protein [Pyrinomonadaceae bacterium]